MYYDELALNFWVCPIEFQERLKNAVYSFEMSALAAESLKFVYNKQTRELMTSFTQSNTTSIRTNLCQFLAETIET